MHNLKIVKQAFVVLLVLHKHVVLHSNLNFAYQFAILGPDEAIIALITKRCLICEPCFIDVTEKTTVPIGDIISATLSTTASGRSSSKANVHNIATTYGTTSSTHAPMNETMDYDRIPVLPTSSSTTTNATINTMTTTTTNLSNRGV